MNSTFEKFLNGSFLFEYPCDDPTECFPIEVTFTTGFWKLECWGASGGEAYNQIGDFTIKGGKGGYSIGVLRVVEDTKAFIYIGGHGLSNVTEEKHPHGGYNGGGDGYGSEYSCSSGGGATDIRIIDQELDSRVIVAGGGGSAGVGNDNSPIGTYGGNGGGINGKDGGNHYQSKCGGGYGGTQYDGGKANQCNGVFSSPGEKGIGGNAGVGSESSGGGGGGGYYGGSGGRSGGGAGGSGFIGKVKNFYSIIAKTIDGGQYFPSPFEELEIGHNGNGYVKITYLKHSMFCTNKCKPIILNSYLILLLFIIIIKK